MVDATADAILLSLATAFRLTLVVVVPGDVERDIQKPSPELLSNHMAGGIEGSFLHQLRQLVGVVPISRGIHFARLGHKDHVTLDVTGRLVVFAVRDLPRKVWNQQGGMADPAHGVVQHLGWGERLMSTFVRQHPQPSTKEALHKGIHAPEHSPDRCGRNIFRRHITVEDVEGGGQRGDVSGNVCQTTSARALETVCWDSVPDLLYGIIWNLELIAIGVEHLPVRGAILEVQRSVGAERR